MGLLLILYMLMIVIWQDDLHADRRKTMAVIQSPL